MAKTAPPPVPAAVPKTTARSLIKIFHSPWSKTAWQIVRHVVLTSVLLLLVKIAALVALYWAELKAQELLSNLRHGDTLINRTHKANDPSNQATGQMGNSLTTLPCGDIGPTVSDLDGGVALASALNSDGSAADASVQTSSTGTESSSSSTLDGGASDASVQTLNGQTVPARLANRSTPGSEMPAAAPPCMAVCKRLNEQLEETRRKARFHLKTVAFLLKNQYMSSIIVSLAGAIAAITLLFITIHGWARTNPYIKNIFLVMTTIAVFFKASPKIYKKEHGITQSKVFYFRYITLEDDICTYKAMILECASSHPSNNSESLKLDVLKALFPSKISEKSSNNTWQHHLEFIRQVDQVLAQDDIHLDVDHSSIPTYSDTINQQIQGNQSRL